jgi:TolA-binding protein
VQYYRLLAKEFPNSDVADDATYRLAHHLQQREEFKEAAEYFATVASRFPDSPLAPQALFASAVCLDRAGLRQDAVRDWSNFVRQFPEHALVEDALYQKALGETRLKRYEEALATFRRLLDRFESTRFAADACYWQGMLLSEAGRFEDAEAEFRRALKRKPHKELRRDAEFNLALVLKKRGRPGQAADLLQKLLATPTRAKFTSSLLEWLAGHWYERKLYGKCVAAAEQLAAQATEEGWKQAGWCLAGRGRLGMGDKGAARGAFMKAVEAEGSGSYLAEAALRLGQIELEAGRHAEAREYLERAAAASSADRDLGIRAHAYAGLARTARATADNEAAARYFMSVAILYDDAELVPECLYEAAQVFRQLGREEPAAKAIRELKERYPDSEWAAKAP